MLNDIDGLDPDGTPGCEAIVYADDSGDRIDRPYKCAAPCFERVRTECGIRHGVRFTFMCARHIAKAQSGTTAPACEGCRFIWN